MPTILSDSPPIIATPSGKYRSRLEQQVKRLLQKQKQGKYLDNIQKRLIRRWQVQQALLRVVKANKGGA